MEEKEAKIVIHIDTAYNVNPSATKVENTFIIGGKEGAKVIREALGKSSSLFALQQKPDTDIDPIRQEILTYVSRVCPILTDEAKSFFMRLWEDILAQPEVADKVYDPGKQWGTNFNRSLVANILHHLRSRKIYKVTYRDNYNGAALAEALESDKEHSVKHALRDEPPLDVRNAIDRLFTKGQEITFNADIVQQLNVNPKEVINKNMNKV